MRTERCAFDGCGQTAYLIVRAPDGGERVACQDCAQTTGAQFVRQLNPLDAMTPRVRKWVEQRSDPAELNAFNAYVADALQLYRASAPDPDAPPADTYSRIAAEADFVARLCDVGSQMPYGVPDDVAARWRGGLWSLLAADPVSRHFTVCRIRRWEDEATEGDVEPGDIALLRRMLLLAD